MQGTCLENNESVDVHQRLPVRGLMHGALHAGAVLGFFTVLFLVLFHRNLADGTFILCGGDDENIHLPYFFAPHAWWNPDLFGGYPALGDPQSMTWYPVAALARYLGSWNLLVISGYVLAGCLMYAWIWHRTGNWLGSAAGGVVFSLSGFLSSHIGHLNMVHASIWIPLVLLAIDKLCEHRSTAWIALGAVGLGNMALAGHPQILAWAGCLCFVYAVAMGWRAPVGTKLAWFQSATMFLLGAGLSAILVLPMHELAGHSVRAALDWKTFSSDSYPPAQLPMLLFPFIFGGHASLEYFGRSSLTEITGFVGLLPMLWIAIAWQVGEDRRQVRFWLIVMAAGLLLALGRNTPLYQVLYVTPILNKFRIPPRHFLEMTVAVSMLTGLGIAGLLRCDANRRIEVWRRSCWLFGAAVAVMLLSSVAVLATGSMTKYMQRRELSAVEVMPWNNGTVWLQLLILGTLVLVGRTWIRRPVFLMSAALLAFITVDTGMFTYLWAQGWRFGPAVKAPHPCPDELQPIGETLREQGQRMATLETTGAIGNGRPNWTQVWSLPVTFGYNPLIPLRHCQLLDTRLNGPEDLHLLEKENRSLDILSSRFLLVPHGMQELLARLRTDGELMARWQKVKELPDGVLFENRTALPGAWLVQDVRTVTGDEALQAIRTSRLASGESFDPCRMAVVETLIEGVRPVADFTSSVKRLGAADTSMSFEVQTNANALLVISDSFYPGWTCAIDGQEAQLFRVNYLLRGVVVPAGSHRLELAFRPTGGRLGLMLTAGSVCLCLGLPLFSAWRTWRTGIA